MKLLVVGARPGSLGAAVKETAQDKPYGWEVVTAGVSGQEDHRVDLANAPQPVIERLVREVRPDHIVCTAGINRSGRDYADRAVWWLQHLEVNCLGPMRLLDAWLSYGPDTDTPWPHFVAISSNSAQIPRSDSAAYCASKAALSMAVRVRARDCANHNMPISVYAYEPGLISGTPMTNLVRERFTGPLTRMRGVGVEHGLSAWGLAAHVMRNLAAGGPELNGVLLRLDAGEI